MPIPIPIEVFISYARSDQLYLDRLNTQLMPLQHNGLVQIWHDAGAPAGWNPQQVDPHLNSAQVILLLISSDFMASDYFGNVVRQALQRHDRGEARVIPIIIGSITTFAWNNAPFNNLQPLPRDRRPIRDSHNQARAFAGVVDEIYRVIRELRTGPSSAEMPPTSANSISANYSFNCLTIFYRIIIPVSIVCILLLSFALVTHYSFPLASSTMATATAKAIVMSNATATANAAICPTTKTLDTIWQVTQGCGILHINYNNGISSPEYGSLDLSSSYFRLNYGPPSSWGTSIVLLPAFWSQSACPSPGLCQGASVAVQPRTEGADLILTIDGLIGKLHVLCVVRLTPPTQNSMSAQVQTTLEGNITLDTNRPNEAFKPVMLTSMHDSSTQWDAQRAYTDSGRVDLPSSGWILSAPAATHRFGLEGGTSHWKKNAPTVEVVFKQPAQMNVTGWVTQSTNPQDDNVAFWAFSSTVLYSWSYTINTSV